MGGAAHGAARNAQLAALRSTYSQLGKRIASSARVIQKAGRAAAHVLPHRTLDNRKRSVPDTPLVADVSASHHASSSELGDNATVLDTAGELSMHDVAIYGTSLRSGGTLTGVPPLTRLADQSARAISSQEHPSPPTSTAQPPGERACMMPPLGASLRSSGSPTCVPSDSRSAGGESSDPAALTGRTGAADVATTVPSQDAPNVTGARCPLAAFPRVRHLMSPPTSCAAQLCPTLNHTHALGATPSPAQTTQRTGRLHPTLRARPQRVQGSVP